MDLFSRSDLKTGHRPLYNFRVCGYPLLTKIIVAL
ncbi:hypothetical protein VPH166E361_0141 [Vibrio phage 166E36-1]